jgi:hypothetical protein
LLMPSWKVLVSAALVELSFVLIVTFVSSSVDKSGGDAGGSGVSGLFTFIGYLLFLTLIIWGIVAYRIKNPIRIGLQATKA